MQRKSTLVVAVALLAVLALTGGPGLVAAHGNHLGADDQVSADGSVLVESMFALRGGFLVVHTDADGQPGEPIGHVGVEMGAQNNVEVQIDESAWRDFGDVTRVWAVLHRDDGDGQFHPSDDPPIQSFGELAATTFDVRKSDTGQAVVSAGSRSVQSTSTPSVVVDRVSLPQEGYLVIQDFGKSGPSAVVGHVALSSGDHTDVSVALDRTYFEGENVEFDVEAVLYADDGDGTFDPEADRPITVGRTEVGTDFSVRKVANEISGGNATGGTGGDNQSTTGGTGDSGGSGGLVKTASETLSTSVETVGSGGSSSSMPGLGTGTALVALAVGVSVLLWRRRGRR